MKKEILLIQIIHSINNNVVFLTAKALEDLSINDKLFCDGDPESSISIERLEMYRKDVTEVPQAYGADITLRVPYRIELKPNDVLYKIDPIRVK